MAKYMQTAADASKTIDSLMDLIPQENKLLGAQLIAYIYNYGIRTAPRPTQSTVRFNAVKEACRNLPVVVTMAEVTTDSGRTFNALKVNANLEPISEG